MHRKAVLLLTIAALVGGTPRAAQAFLQFNKQFLEVYVASSDNEEFTDFVTKEAKCWVCHQGKLRKNRNVYGTALDELLGPDDKNDAEKIVEALKKVADQHSDAKDEESPTFGELIKQGKLPGGELEELKKEPAEEEAEK